MSSTPAAVPVLEIGGTHVTAALVADDTVVEQHRIPLDAAADAMWIVNQIAHAAGLLRALPNASRWAVAIPGPFDYRAGIADFSGVDKFRSLQGFDLGAALRGALPGAPTEVSFLNDAEAYAVGEWRAFEQPYRFLCITLGTGIGSGFILDGRPVTTGPDVPQDGNIHTETWHELPLEQSVSRDAIRRVFSARTGSDLDVAEIAHLARKGQSDAAAVLTEAMIALGLVLARWVDRFEPDVVVIGGSMSRSWDVLQQGLLYGLGLGLGFAERETVIAPARKTDEAPLIGAATHLAMATARHESATPSSAPPQEKGQQRRRPGQLFDRGSV